MQKTTLAKRNEVERKWHLIDLDGKVLGRAATRIADILQGKKKAIYTPHADTGDFVVAINAGKIRLTGRKLEEKIYYRHTGFRGGLQSVTAGKLLQKDPARVLVKAVHGMLPKNKTNQHLMKRLKIYRDSIHPHQAQQPQPVEPGP